VSTGRRDVERMLGSYTRPAWETWARARGLDPGKLYGPALPKELARLLLAPSALRAAMAETTAEERTALARIEQEGGKIPAQELKALLLIDGVNDPDAHLIRLMARGLLFYDRSMEGYYARWDLWDSTKDQPAYMPALWLPAEVRELVTVPEDMGRLPLEAAPEPNRVCEGSFATLQRDLYLLLQELRENPAKLLKSGGVSKRDSERLLKILPAAGVGENDATAKARTDGAWFAFLWFLVQQAGLLQEEPGRMIVSPDGLQFLTQDEGQQARVLLRAWVTLEEWNEFRRVPTLEFEDAEFAFNETLPFQYVSTSSSFSDAPSSYQLNLARALLMELFLRERPHPGWHSVPSLLASMKRLRVNFLIPRSDRISYMPWGARGGKQERCYRGFYARGSSPPRYFHKDRDWEQVEGAFLRTLLEEPLLWLGIVRLGFAGDELVSFQFTERGAVAVGLVEAPTAPPSRKRALPAETPAQRALVVQPNFEVVVYPEVAGIPLLVELDRFAQRVRMDRAALYRLTRPDLCRGLQEGLTLAEILETLEVANAGPLPQNVAYSLAEWERQFNRIQVRRSVSLIEAADDAELQALRALPELSDAREIAPRVLLAPPRAGLRRLPGEPVVIDYVAPITRALEFETATRLRVLPGALTPRLRHRLLQIADPLDESHHGDRVPAERVMDTEGTQRGMVGRKGGITAEVAEAAEASVSSTSSSDLSVSPLCPSPAPRVPGLCGESLRFELSREKISRAARWWRWEAMETFLAGAARSQPPADLTVMLRGWSGVLPPAAVASVTLFVAPGAGWLDMVMQAPDVKRRVLYRLSPTVALVREEDRPHLEAALAVLGIATSPEVGLRQLIENAAQAEAEAGEVLVVGPPRKRRALLEQAIAQKRRVVIAEMPYTGRLVPVKVDPLRIEGEGAGAALVARVEGYRHEYRYSLNRLQGVRVLDEPAKP
jgi:hypothetical protein